MIANASTINLLLVLISSQVLTTLTCNYPATLRNVKFHWRIMSPDYSDSSVRHFRRKLDFTASRMSMEYIASSYRWQPAVRTVNYTCIEAAGSNTFLVRVDEDKKQIYYRCMQFVFRSTNVVQLKFSVKTDNKTEGSCRDAELVLMDAPIAYYYDQGNYWSEARNVHLPYHACPLKGGYVLSQWYENDRAMCKSTPAAPMSVKVENECERGEGLGLLGGSSTCKSVYTGYPLYCLADWTAGEFTYMVLFRDLIDFDLLCMRYPTAQGAHFTAYLFLDGVCDTSRDILKSHQYRKMELIQYADPLADECSNDSPKCNEFIPPTNGCDRIWSTFCRWTCKTCPWKRPWRNITIPEEYQGAFYKDTYSQGQEVLTINEHYIHIPSLGKYQFFGKSTCFNKKHARGMGTGLEELIFLQSFNNGCSPRLVVIQLSTRTPLVISIRMSLSVNIDWNRFKEISHTAAPDYGSLGCPTSRKFRKPPINIGETFRTLPHGWFNLVRIENSDKNTNLCESLPKFKYIKTKFTNGGTCVGAITKTSVTTFSMSLKNCQKGDSAWKKLTGDINFECLSTFKAKVGRTNPTITTFMITKTVNLRTLLFNESMHCWMYSTQHKDRLLMYKISDCDSNAEIYFYQYGAGVKHVSAIIEGINKPEAVNFHATSGSQLHSLCTMWAIIILVQLIFY